MRTKGRRTTYKKQHIDLSTTKGRQKLVNSICKDWQIEAATVDSLLNNFKHFFLSTAQNMLRLSTNWCCPMSSLWMS